MMALRLASLQSRVLVLVLALVSAIWLAVAAVIWVEARHEIDELLDGHLAQAAALLVAQQARVDADEEDVADAPSLHKYAPQVAFQVFHEGHLSLRSTNAPSTPMADIASGFTTVQLGDGSRWRVFATTGAEADVRVYVGEQTKSRNSILWVVLRSVVVPMGLALPVLALALWWAVRQGLRPLRLVSQMLGERSPQALAPLEVSPMPSEVRPLVDALNALFVRIDRMVHAERRFTADAAHELRTPIAVIRTQAQVAQGAQDNAAERQHALQATIAGCDRASRLIDQLLTLARLEGASHADAASRLAAKPVDLSAVVRSIGAQLAPLALARQQVLELEASAPCWVQGDEVLLGVLVRNLLDNALRYSPNGAQVQLEVGQHAGQVFLCVQDSGPGLDEAQMARLGERFFRVLGAEASGSGLGWSIVKRLVDVFGAQIQVRRAWSLGGLAVRIEWPPVSAP